MEAESIKEKYFSGESINTNWHITRFRVIMSCFTHLPQFHLLLVTPPPICSSKASNSTFSTAISPHTIFRSFVMVIPFCLFRIFVINQFALHKQSVFWLSALPARLNKTVLTGVLDSLQIFTNWPKFLLLAIIFIPIKYLSY